MANLLAGLLPEATGIIRFRSTRCGKPGCHCNRGELHGPYAILQYRVRDPERGWVTKSKYIRKDELDTVNADLIAARRFTKASLRGEYLRLKDRVNQIIAPLGGSK